MASVLDSVADLIGRELLASVGLGGELGARLAALSVVVAVAVLLWRLLQSSGAVPAAKGDALLLVGPLGSGKTAAAMALRQGTFRPTVTSMAESDARFAVHQSHRGEGGRPSGQVRVVDFPGHGSQRYRLAKLLPQARAVAFFVDAAAPKAALQEAGEFLYTVLTSRPLVSARTPVRVLLAKADLDGARTREQVEEELLSVLNKKEAVKHSMEDLDAGAEKPLDLGRGPEAGPFAFSHHACQVSFGSVSARDGRLADLVSLLA